MSNNPIEINDSFRQNDSSNSNNHLLLQNTHYNTNPLTQSQYCISKNQNQTQECESNSSLAWSQGDDKKQELLSNISDKESLKEDPKGEDLQSRASDKNDIKEDPKGEDLISSAFDKDGFKENQNNILLVSSYSKDDPTNKRGTFYNNLYDRQNKNFIIVPCNTYDDGNQIQVKNKAEIQHINEDTNEVRNNKDSTKSNTHALFVTNKKTDDDKDIPFKKEEAKKSLRVRVINESHRKLNNYIKKSTNLPRHLKKKNK